MYSSGYFLSPHFTTALPAKAFVS